MQRTSTYQTPRRREPPLPPLWVTPARTVEKTPLAQFVVLSMLLHALFILIFGAPSGGSREGRAMWGSMQVTLQGPLREATPAPPVERKAVEPAPIAPAPAPQPLEPSVAREIERTAVPEARPEPFAFPPLLDRIVIPERKLEMAPPLPLPTKADVIPPPPPPTPPPEPAITPEPPAPPVEVAAPVPVTPPVDRPPVEVPVLPVPQTQSIAPPRIEAAPKPVETAPAQEIPVSPKPPVLERVEPHLPPAARPDPVESPAKIEPELRGPEAPALRPSPFKSPAPSTDSSTYDPTAPSIDLDAVRNRAGEIAREGFGRRGILAFPMPPLPERKSKMETAIENARKPDCRTAYSALGLAAIVPLIANEFGEGKCRW